MNALPASLAAFDALALRLLGAVGTGLYQGLLVTALVVVALRAFRRANATTRYALEWVTLLIVAALPVLHFLRSPSATARSSTPREWAEPPTMEAASPSRAVSAAVELLVDATEAPPHPRGSLETSASTARLLGEPSDGVESASSPTASGEAPERLAVTTGLGIARSSGDAEARAVESAVVASQDVAEPPKSSWTAVAVPWEAALSAGWARGLIVAWVLMTGMRLLALARQCVALRRGKRAGHAAPAELARQVEALRVAMGVRRSVDVRCVPTVTVPMVVGFRRPAIVLPADLAHAAPTDLEGLLRHELAHVDRRDDWTNLVQQILAAVLFFHPAVQWLGRRLTVSREIACDDHVLAAMGCPREYALMLTNFARRSPAHNWVAAPAAWNKKSQLKERIVMILDANRNASPRLARTKAGMLSTGALVLAGLGLWAAPRLVLAQAEVGGSDAVVEAGASTGGATSAAGAVPLTSSEAKVKATVGDDATAVLVVPPAPAAAPAPTPSVAPAPAPLVLVAPPMPPAPSAGTVLALPTPKGDPMERRLARLEKLVESLLKKDGKAEAKTLAGLSADAEAWSRQKADAEAKFRQQADKMKQEGLAKKNEFFQWDTTPDGKSRLAMNFNFNLEQELNQILEQVAREVEKASGDARRAAKAAETMANKGVEASKDAAHLAGAEFQVHRRALEEQRKALQKRLGEIEGQLERLSDQLEKVDDHLDRAEDARDRALEQRDRAREERERVRLRQRHPDARPEADTADPTEPKAPKPPKEPRPAKTPSADNDGTQKF